MMLSRWLDKRLYRGPFVGRSAKRYQREERPAFGDLDERLLARLEARLATARLLVEIGAGPGCFADTARRRFSQLAVLAVEPSRCFTPPSGALCVQAHSEALRVHTHAEALRVHAYAEALPLNTASCDMAVFVSSIRHVQDRLQTFREVRRVLQPTGLCVVVELDPTANAAQARHHAQHLGRWWQRVAFAPLVLRTAPDAQTFADLAMQAGLRRVRHERDEKQPIYISEFEPM